MPSSISVSPSQQSRRICASRVAVPGRMKKRYLLVRLSGLVSDFGSAAHPRLLVLLLPFGQRVFLELALCSCLCFIFYFSSLLSPGISTFNPIFGHFGLRQLGMELNVLMTTGVGL
jgi:hypothetical protein